MFTKKIVKHFDKSERKNTGGRVKAFLPTAIMATVLGGGAIVPEVADTYSPMFMSVAHAAISGTYNASSLSGAQTVNSGATLTLNGGTLTSGVVITGAGRIVISGTVYENANSGGAGINALGVTGGVTVNSGATLNIHGNRINTNITNNGTVVLLDWPGYTNEFSKTITGGTVKMNGNVKVSANYVKSSSVTIASDKTWTVNGGTLTAKVSGTGIITAGATFTTNAGNLAATGGINIAGGKDLYLTGGTLSQTVSGSGWIYIMKDADVTVTAAQNVPINMRNNTGNKLRISGENITGKLQGGTTVGQIYLTGGTLGASTTFGGTGQVIIDGTVDCYATTSGSMFNNSGTNFSNVGLSIPSGKTLSAWTDRFGGSLTNIAVEGTLIAKYWGSGCSFNDSTKVTTMSYTGTPSGYTLNGKTVSGNGTFRVDANLTTNSNISTNIYVPQTYSTLMFNRIGISAKTLTVSNGVARINSKSDGTAESTASGDVSFSSASGHGLHVSGGTAYINGKNITLSATKTGTGSGQYGAYVTGGTVKVTATGNLTVKSGGEIGIYHTGGTATYTAGGAFVITPLNGYYGTVYVSGGNLTLSGGSNSKITGVTAGNYGDASTGGAAVYNKSTTSVSGFTFSNNTALTTKRYRGGAIYSSGTITVSNSKLSANVGKEGGAFFQNGGTSTISGSTFYANTSSGSWGEAIGLATKGKMTISDSTFYGNTSTFAGGTDGSGNAAIILYNNGYELTLSGTNKFYNNYLWDIGAWTATAASKITFSAGGTTYLNNGLHIFNSGTTALTVAVSGTVHSKNLKLASQYATFTVNSGGVVDNNYYATSGTGSNMTLTTGTVSGQGVFTMSAGAFNVSSGGKATLSNLAVTGGSFSSSTGSLYFTKSASSTSTVSSRKTTSALVTASGGTFSTDGLTFSGNANTTATGWGHGPSFLSAGGALTLEVKNSKFDGNYTNQLGTIISGSSTGSMTFTSDTFQNNFAAMPGGVMNIDGTKIYIKDSVFQKNFAGSTAGGTSNAGGALRLASGGTANFSGTNTFKTNFSQDSGGAIGAFGSNASTLMVLNFNSGTTTFGGSADGDKNVAKATLDFTNHTGKLTSGTGYYNDIFMINATANVGDGTNTTAVKMYGGIRGGTTSTVNVKNKGTLTMYSAADLNGVTNISVLSGGVLDMSGTTGSITGASTNFSNAGTLTMGSGIMGSTLTNTGTVNYYGTKVNADINDTGHAGYVYVKSGTVDLTGHKVQAKRLVVTGGTGKADVSKVDLADATAVILYANGGTLNLQNGSGALKEITVPAKSTGATSYLAVDNNGAATVDGGTNGITFKGLNNTTTIAPMKVSQDSGTAAKGTLTLKGKLNFTGNTAGTAGVVNVLNSGVLNLEGTLTFSGNKAGTVANDIKNTSGTVNAKGTVSMNGGISGSSGTVNVTGGTTILTGSAGIAGQTTIAVSSGATLNMSGTTGSITGAGTSFTNAGTLKMGSGTLGSNLTNTGSVYLNGTTLKGNISDANTKGAVYIGSGTMTVSNSYTIQAKTLGIQNGGVLNIDTKSLKLERAGTAYDGNMLDVASGGTLKITAASAITLKSKAATDDRDAGYLGVTGNATIDNTGAITFQGSYTTNPTTKGVLGGAVNVYSGGVYTTKGTVNYTNAVSRNGGAAVYVSGTFTIAGSSAFTGSNNADICNKGTTKLTGSVSMTKGITGSSGKLYIGDNDSTANTVTLTGTAGIAGQTTLVIYKDGTLDMSGASGNISGVSTSFTNAGTIKTGTGDIASLLTNTGTVTANKGKVSGGITNNGDSAKIDIGGATISGTLTNTNGTINLTSGTVSGTVSNKDIINVTDAASFTGNSSITNESGGTITLSSGTLGRSITNKNILNIIQGVINAAITDSGTVNINGAVESKKDIANKVVIKASTGELTISAGAVGSSTNGITNNNKLTLKGGTVTGATKNVAGSTYVLTNGAQNGDVTNAGTMTVNGGTVKTITNTSGITVQSANSLLGVITNNTGGTVTLKGGTLGSKIGGTGGQTVIDGTVKSNAAISNTGGITVNSDKSLEITGANLMAAVTNKGTLTLTGTGTDGNLGANISSTGKTVVTGTITNSGNKTITQNDLTVSGSLTTEVDKLVIGNTIVNNGSLVLSSDSAGSDTLEEAVSGTGSITVNGVVTAKKFLSNSGGIGISSSKKLTVDVDNIGTSVTNSGTIVLTTDGTDNNSDGQKDILTQTVTGTGKIEINGAVTSSQSIGSGGGSIVINAGKSLSIGAANLAGTTYNSGTLTLTGNSTLNSIVYGDGTVGTKVSNVIIDGTITSNKAIYGTVITINNGDSLTVDAGNLKPYTAGGTAATIDNRGTLIFTGGTLTENIQTGSGTGTVSVKSGRTVILSETGNVSAQNVALDGVLKIGNATVTTEKTLAKTLTVNSGGILDLRDGKNRNYKITTLQANGGSISFDMLKQGGTSQGGAVYLAATEHDTLTTGTATGTLKLESINMGGDIYTWQDGDNSKPGFSGIGELEFDRIRLISGNVSGLTIQSTSTQYGDFLYAFTQDTSSDANRGDLIITKAAVNFGLREVTNAQDQKEGYNANAAGVGTYSFAKNVVNMKPYAGNVATYNTIIAKSESDRSEGEKVLLAAIIKQWQNIISGSGQGEWTGQSKPVSVQLKALQDYDTLTETKGLGTLTPVSGKTLRTLTINGNGKELNGGGFAGITIRNVSGVNQGTLNIVNVSSVKNFANNIVAYNDGNLNVKDSTMQLDAGVRGNITASGIAGTLTITNSKITVGTFNVAKNVTDYKLIQGSVTIGNNSELNVYAGDLAVTGLANRGTLNLWGGKDKVNASVLANTGITENTGTINIASGHHVKMDKTSAMAGQIQNDGAFYVEDSTRLTGGKLTNNGMLELGVGSLKIPVTGTGSTTITGKVTNNSTVSQKTFVVSGTDTVFTTPADALTVTNPLKIENGAAVELTGGDGITRLNFNNKAEGDGKVIINGDVAVTKVITVTGGIAVNTGKVLTTDVDYIGTDVTNNGIVRLTGDGKDKNGATAGSIDTLTKVISGGSIEIKNNITSDAANLKGTVINSNNILVITGGTSDESKRLTVSVQGVGSTVIGSTAAGAFIDAEQAIQNTVTVKSGSGLKVNADNLQNTVENNGMLTLTGGEITKKITGTTGSTVVDGTVTFSAKVEQKSLTIENMAALQSDVLNLSIQDDSIVNRGALTVSGSGTLAKGIEGIGSLRIDGSDITVEGAVNNVITISGSKKLTIDPDNIKKSVTDNAGTLCLNKAGTLTQTVSGTGLLKTMADVTNSNGNRIAVGRLQISGGTFTANAADIVVTQDITNSGTLKLTGGTLGNNIGGSGTVTVDAAGKVSMSGSIGQKVLVQGGTLAYTLGTNRISGDIVIGAYGTAEIGLANTTGNITLEESEANKGRVIFTSGGTYTKAIRGSGVVEIAKEATVAVGSSNMLSNTTDLDVKGTLDATTDVTVRNFNMAEKSGIKFVDGDVSGVLNVAGAMCSTGGKISLDIDLGSVVVSRGEVKTITSGFDQINVAGKAEGVISIESISLLNGASLMEKGSYVQMQIVKSAGANTITIDNSVAVTSDGARYTFSQATQTPADKDNRGADRNGYLQVYKEEGYSLYQIVTGTKTPGDSYDPATLASYILITDDWDAKDADEEEITKGHHMKELGTLSASGSSAERDLTISGNGNRFVTTGDIKGITVDNSNHILRFSDVSIIEGFKDYVVKNHSGTVEFTTKNGTSICSDMINSGTLEFGKGSIVLNAAISGNGTTKINSAADVTVESGGTISQGVLDIMNGGSLTVNGAALTVSDTENGITNNGTLTVTGGTVANKLNGDGILVVSGDTQLQNISMNTLEIMTGKTLTTNADYIGNTVTNRGSIIFTGGTLQHLVKDGADRAGIIALSGNMTADADNLGSDVVNRANTLTVTGGTIVKGIDGKDGSYGDVIITGTVTSAGVIHQNKVKINSTGSLETALSNLTVQDSVENAGILTLTGNGTLDKAINGGGRLNITGSVAGHNSIRQNVINITADGAALDTGVNAVLEVSAINNAGRLTLTGSGTLAATVNPYTEGGKTDIGTVVIDGDITAASPVNNFINVKESADVLKADANNIGGQITNNGTVRLSGGTGLLASVLAHGINGGMLAVTTGNVINSSNVGVRSFTVDSAGSFTTDMNNITVSDSTVINNGRLILTGGTVTNAISTTNQGTIVNKSTSGPGGYYEIDTARLGSMVVVPDTLTVQNTVDSVVAVQAGGTLITKPEYVAGGVVLQSEIDSSTGHIIYTKAANIVANEAGLFNAKVGGAGVIVVNKDLSMGSDANFVPLTYISSGETVIPVSGVSLTLNAQMSMSSSGMVNAGSGALQDLTVNDGGHLNMVNGTTGILAIVGDFRGNGNAKLSLDVIDDTHIDTFVIMGNASGTITLGTVNIKNELITNKFVQDGDKYYFGYRDARGNNVYLDRDGHITEEESERVEIGKNGKVTGTNSISVWQDLPIYGTDNLTINGTTVVSGMYRYTISYEPNSDAGNDKQLKIKKDVGFTLHEIIQGYIAEDNYKTAQIDTYSLTQDITNVVKYNETDIKGGGALGTLTRIDAGSYNPGGRTGGSTNRTFTINGNSQSLNGGGWGGIIVQQGDTLILTDIATVSNFKDGIVTENNGTVRLDGGATMVCAGVTGTGTLEINGADVTIANATKHLTEGAYKLETAQLPDETVAYTFKNSDDEVIGITDYIPKIQQNRINIVSGSFTANANALDVQEIYNDAKLILTDAYVPGQTEYRGTVNGLGTVIVNAGDLVISGVTRNTVQIENDAQLTISADNMSGAVINRGTLQLHGGTLTNTISGGSVKILGDVTSPVTNISCDSITVASGKTLTFGSGELVQQIGNGDNTAGTMAVGGDVVVKADIYTGIDVNNGRHLTADAWFIKGNIQNKGIVTLTARNGASSGVLGRIISDGTVDISGNIITDAINLQSDVVRTDSSNTLTLTGNSSAGTGTLCTEITGDGMVSITGDVSLTAGGKLNNEGGIVVAESGILTAAAGVLGDDVNNNGTLVLGGPEFVHNITGSGMTVLCDDFALTAQDQIATAQSVTVTGGKTLSTQGNLLALDGLMLQDNSVLNMQNSIMETLTLARLDTGSNGAELKIDVDLSDGTNDKIIVGTGAAGSVRISEGTAVIKGINLLNDMEGEVGTKTQVVLFEGELDGLDLSDKITTQLGVYKYIFTRQDTKGSYEVVKDYGKTLKEVVNNKDGSGSTSTYILLNDYTADNDMGNLTRADAPENTEAGTEPREFTVDLRGHKYSGGNCTGIAVKSGDVLNVKNAAQISDWNSYAFNNNGTLNFANVASLQSSITGNGIMTVTGDMTADKSVTQDTLVINDGTLTTADYLKVNALAGTGSVVLAKDMKITADKMTLTGTVANNARLTVEGSTDAAAPFVLSPTVTGRGSTQVTGYVSARTQQLDQTIEMAGQSGLNVTGDGSLKRITGNGVITLDGNITLTDNVAAQAVTVNNGNITTVTGKTIAAGTVTLRGGTLTIERTNILDANYMLNTSLITDINGESGTLTLDLQGADYTSSNFAGARQLLFGNGDTEQAQLVFVNGNLKIDDEGTESAEPTEALVIYGETTDNSIAISGIKTTVISTKEIPGTSVTDGTKMMEVNTDDEQAVAQLKTKTVKVVENTDARTVDDNLKKVDTISICKNSTNTVSDIIAKDLQIKELASKEDLTIVVGTENDEADTSTLVLVGDEDGIVKNAKSESVATQAVIHKGATLTIGDKKASALGSSGTLTNITVDGTLNVYETVLTVNKISAGITGRGIIYVDPSYLQIKDVSGFEDVQPVVWVDADGAVLNLGDTWTARELEQIVQKMGYSTQTYTREGYTTGFVAKENCSILAIGTNIDLGGNGALIASINTTGYDKQTVKGLHFDANSVIIADAKTAATAEGLISGISEMTDIADTSKLHIVAVSGYQFKEGDVLTILSGEGITETNTYWNMDNITLSDDSFDIEEIQISGNKYQIKVTEILDSSVIADVVNTMRKMNPDFRTFNKNLRSSYGSSRDEGYKKAVNAIGNIGEMAGLQHGAFVMGMQIGEVINENIGLATIPAMSAEPGRVMNTISGGMSMPVVVVEQGQEKNIMPASGINTDKYPKQVWAGYMYNRENVTGLSLGGVDANYKATYKGTIVGTDLWTDEKSLFGVAVSYSDGNVAGYDNGVSSRNESKYYGISLYDRVTFGDDKALILDIGYLQSKNDIEQNNHGTPITADSTINGLIGGARLEKSYSTRKLGTFMSFTGIRMMCLDNRSYTTNFGMEYTPDKQFVVMPEIGLRWTARYADKKGKGIFAPNVQIGFVWNLGDRNTEQKVSFGGITDRVGYDVADSRNYFASIGMVYYKDNFTISIGHKYQKGDAVKNNKWNVNMGFVF